MSLRGRKTTEAISKGIENTGIAALLQVARNDPKGTKTAFSAPEDADPAPEAGGRPRGLSKCVFHRGGGGLPPGASTMIWTFMAFICSSSAVSIALRSFFFRMMRSIFSETSARGTGAAGCRSATFTMQYPSLSWRTPLVEPTSRSGTAPAMAGSRPVTWPYSIHAS